jgi:hypothetical protein
MFAGKTPVADKKCGQILTRVVSMDRRQEFEIERLRSFQVISRGKTK